VKVTDSRPRAAQHESRQPSSRALGLALLVATVVAYLPALRAGYIWDDDKYLTENPVMGSLAGLLRIWVPGNTPQYYPAVFTTFWLEHGLWGLDPVGYHAVNVVLHGLAAVLVWRLGLRLCIPGAWFLGALFALHPVHVESVAWITERKNVLSGVFYLLAALAYLRFVERERSDSPPDARRWRWYGLAFALFVLALLSKTVTCSLPAALILMRLWRREGLDARFLAPLAPLFLVGLVLALHTAHLERTQVGAEGAEFAFSALERVQIASRALLFYPQKLLCPWPLAFVYPRWELGGSLAYAPVAIVLAVAAAALAAYRRGVCAPALALAFFAGTLFPALGFFNVFPMRYSFVADHFQYLASLGVLALVVGAAASRVSNRRGLALAGTAVLVACGALTWRQSALYANEETLWRATLDYNARAWMAQNNLARVLSDRGDNAEALVHLQRALESDPSERAAGQLRLNIALTLAKLGRYEEALAAFQELQRSTGGMEVRIAQALDHLGRFAEAEASFRAALAGKDAADALLPFGLFLARRGRTEEAIGTLERFVAARPSDIDGLMHLADAYADAGRIGDAIQTAEKARAAAQARGDARTGELIARRLGELRRP